MAAQPAQSGDRRKIMAMDDFHAAEALLTPSQVAAMPQDRDAMGAVRQADGDSQLS